MWGIVEGVGFCDDGAMSTYRVGDRVLLDGTTPAVVTATDVYVGRMRSFREVGVSVCPDGGRSRVVSLKRIQPVEQVVRKETEQLARIAKVGS